MTQEERNLLQQEWRELNDKVKTADFINPKDMRRMDEITSLLMTDGQSDAVRFKFVKGKDSKRVTAFRNSNGRKGGGAY